MKTFDRFKKIKLQFNLNVCCLYSCFPRTTGFIQTLPLILLSVAVFLASPHHSVDWASAVDLPRRNKTGRNMVPTGMNILKTF